MPVNHENIVLWKGQSNIDYITHFIKAWIPFNAWFNNNYPQLRTDREKIGNIKNLSNTVRNGINNFMESDSQESIEFRNYLSSLFFQLEQNQIDGRDGRIWFSNILKEKNPIDLIDNEEMGHNKYYLKRTDSTTEIGKIEEIKVILKRKSNSETLFNYTHTEYDYNHIQRDHNYQALSDRRKEDIRLLFQKLTPIIIKPILQTDKDEHPKNYYFCDPYSFIRDVNNTNCYANSVCKALIEVLYQLRNVLFHGELVPNQGAQKVYKEAYLILKLIIELL